MSDAQRIVIFGVNGQLGHRLVEVLGAQGYEVTGIDRAQCDFASATAKDIAVIIRAVEPVAVINAAAYTAVDKAEEEGDLASRINAEAPAHLAVACAEQQIPLVHFSTDYVFDGLAGTPYAENAATNPLGVYAKSKLAGEQVVASAGGHVFRLQWVFDSRGKNFFLTMKQLLAERAELRVVADQLGSPSYALHVAQAIGKALPLILAGTLKPGIHHLTADGFTSWHGFASAIATATESSARVLPIVTSEYPTAAARPKDGRLDASALAAHGIRMPHWQAGLAQAMKDA